MVLARIQTQLHYYLLYIFIGQCDIINKTKKPEVECL